MSSAFKLQYHYHSGFSVQFEKTLLVFDYWEGENRSLQTSGRLTPDYLKQFETIYVFISHDHPDHFDRIVYTWEEQGLPVTYLVSSDFQIGQKGRRMAPGMCKQLDDQVTVTAFPSTDLGVSWLVEFGGVHLFHAGDLNLWHWRNESTLREIEAAEKNFEECLVQLDGTPMDIALFPVDPRQGEMYDVGAVQFIMRLKPRLFVPMHWQERVDVPVSFAKNARTPGTEILPMIQPGCVADIALNGGFIDVHLIDPPGDFHNFPPTGIHNPEKQLEGADVSDPFSDSDLPVDFDDRPEPE